MWKLRSRQNGCLFAYKLIVWNEIDSLIVWKSTTKMTACYNQCMINQSRMYLTLASKGMVNLKCEKKTLWITLMNMPATCVIILFFSEKAIPSTFFLTAKMMKSNPSHNYYHQVQGQLHVMNKDCCDFVVWTNVDMVVVRIGRDREWTEKLSKITDWYFDTFIPSLLEWMQQCTFWLSWSCQFMNFIQLIYWLHIISMQ